MYQRICNILKTRSFFLFGARGTGKSSLLKKFFKQDSPLWIDLLNDRDFLLYSRNPSLLYDQAISLSNKSSRAIKWIIIDEVQRAPQLLNEVHRILESEEARGKIQFGLTGSSARKLKRGAANLLAGRALINNLYPLTASELGEDFNLDHVLNWGSLPAVITEKDPLTRSEILESYVASYLREEIREEQVVRKLDPFLRFLEVAAQTSGQIVNYSAITRDCQVDQKAVMRYFQILEDTLLGVFLPGFDRSVRKQQSKSPRFYLFDLGVQRALRGALNLPISPQSYEYGKVFEQFIILEIIRLNSYLRTKYKLSHLRTKDDAEIDLIIERPGLSTVLMEIKSSQIASIEQARHVKMFINEIKGAEAWLVSQDMKSRTEGEVRMVYWCEALGELFPQSATLNL